MKQFTFQTNSVLETKRLAEALGKRLTLPAVVAVTGRLGAGKTHFIKGLGQSLGLDPDKICSATFVIIAEYGSEKRLIHIDAYRLGSPQELQAIGWYELLEEQNVLIAVEWADKIVPLLPADRIDIQIDIISDEQRKITITANDCRGEACLALLKP